MSDEQTTPQVEEPQVETTEQEAEPAEYSLAVPERPDQTPEQEQLAIQVEDAMFEVMDPEIGINVVDLGLVYDIWIENDTEAVIHMTLTSPACPLTDMLESQTESMVMEVPGVSAHRINWVWTPAWGPQFITEDGRDQMRALGFSV